MSNHECSAQAGTSEERSMIPCPNTAARSVLNGLAVGTLLAMMSLPVGATLSARAVSHGTTTSDYPPASVTNVAGGIVSQSATGENYYIAGPDKVVLGTTTGSARASVDYGVNRIELNTSALDLRSKAGAYAPYTYVGYASGLAESYWFDR